MANPVNYPLRFEPIFKERLWGGRRLETVLRKKLPAGKLIGESWEICDYGPDPSIIANGPLRGRTLRELIKESGEQLLGDANATRPSRHGTGSLQFPLLVKWIDAQENLSIQVHPPDGHPRLPAGERGKTECWFVVEAEPGAEIYLGLRRGIDRSAFIHELTRGTVRHCLNVFPARPGDFYFVPAGTPHAIGAGVLLAEIQQTSDVTYRLFDWNRVDPTTGRPRQLQIEHALDSIDFQATSPITDHVPSGQGCDVQTLLNREQCSIFTVTWRRPVISASLGHPDRCSVLVCLGGTATLSGSGETVNLAAGDCVVLPVGTRCDFKPTTVFEFVEAMIEH